MASQFNEKKKQKGALDLKSSNVHNKMELWKKY